jgi:hypothetical protein
MLLLLLLRTMLLSTAGLKCLRLSGCPRLTSSGLVPLTALTGLRQLIVEACATTLATEDADYAEDSIQREDFVLSCDVSCAAHQVLCCVEKPCTMPAC